MTADCEIVDITVDCGPAEIVAQSQQAARRDPRQGPGAGTKYRTAGGNVIANQGVARIRMDAPPGRRHPALGIHVQEHEKKSQDSLGRRRRLPHPVHDERHTYQAAHEGQRARHEDEDLAARRRGIEPWREEGGCTSAGRFWFHPAGGGPGTSARPSIIPKGKRSVGRPFSDGQHIAGPVGQGRKESNLGAPGDGRTSARAQGRAGRVHKDICR